MLVSLALENWACFRDRLEFSMETVGRVPKEFAFNTDISRYPRLNRVATIYGPNGSGKSSFVDALLLMKHLVIESAKSTQAGEPIEVKPFLFDARSVLKPTQFEIAFVENGVVYEFGFAADSERIWKEWLFVRPPGGRIQRWYSRAYDHLAKEYDWAFGSSLRGSRELWRKATRPEALYVSTAVQLNSESLLPVVEWFRRLAIVGTNGLAPNFTSHLIRKDEDFRERLIEFLRQADISFSNIRVREEEMDLDLVARHFPASILDQIRDADDVKVLVAEFGLRQKGTNALIYLDLDDQSDGTQRVYAFAGPWLDVIDSRRVVVVDELDRSLHPHLVKFLINFINCAGQTGDQRAQLVATVHDTTLLRDALDRNQIWFSEKDVDQAASLTPASNYRPRKSESLFRGYHGGRYGAIPNVAEAESIGQALPPPPKSTPVSAERSLPGRETTDLDSE